MAGKIYCKWEGEFFDNDPNVFIPMGDAYLHYDLGHTTDGLTWPPDNMPPPAEVPGPGTGQG